MSTNQQLLDKYHDIIAQEVNVKQVTLLPDTMQVTKTYVPIGKELSASFGKDTGQIIGAAKQGNVEPLDDGNIKVMNNGNEWILNNTQYEIRYSWLQGDNQIVEEWAIVELDLTITPELHAEWVAREISRFLNQMRKDADYNVSDRVACTYTTDSEQLQAILQTFSTFLQAEALLSSIEHKEHTGDITSEFSSDEGIVQFTLKS